MTSTNEIPEFPRVDSSDLGKRWNYNNAFSRNRGLISPDEQLVLRDSRVAVCGMGGVGGVDLITLARLGIGRFSIADPDIFGIENMNRQYGASMSTLDQSKANVMARMVRDINPEADIRVFNEPIGPNNVEEFLLDADILVDAIEVFEPDVRRLLFRQAEKQNIYAITAGPVGFSGIWIVFDPAGMKFDEYFGMQDEMDAFEKLAAFVIGVAPKATHRSYMDMRHVSVSRRFGPSSSIGCHIAASAMACEAVKVLLKKGEVKVAPVFHQFDPFTGQYARGRLRWGNRGVLQRIKHRYLVRALRKNAASERESIVNI